MPNPTHSGLTRLIWNFRERMVSDDLNRSEQYLAAAAVEQLRHLYLASAVEDEAEGKTAVASLVTTPLRAIVLEGLRVRPEIGTTSLFIEPGALVCASPDADPHPADSTARFIVDGGQQTAGQLVLTAGGGGTRIDLVECAPSNVVIEADSRDIFNPGTGLFAPVNINKVARGALTYRIRTGVAGGGMPAREAGWLPLAVCSVPSSATTWDDVTVWDVRPLLADLARPPHLVVEQFPRSLRQFGSVIEEGAGNWRARGVIDLELSGWKCGGDIATAASGLNYVRLDSGGGNQEPGFAAVASSPYYLYLAQPFGLPRWCKLSPSTSGERTPQSPRGIPIFTQKAPAGLSGKAGSAISLPTATGLGGSTTNAIVALAGVFGVGTAFCALAQEGGAYRLENPGIALAPASGAATSTVVYSLVGNTSYPAHARAVSLRFSTTVSDTTGTVHGVSRELRMRDSTGVVVYSRKFTTTETVPAAGSYTDVWELDLSITPNLPTGAAQTVSVELTFGVTGGVGPETYSGQSAVVCGWQLF